MGTPVQPGLFEELDAISTESAGSLRELFTRTGQYATSGAYLDLLRFIGRFPQHAAYNAFLLHVQNPELRYVTTAKKWEGQFGRRVKPGARAYIVLIPFGPVQLVYDIADTEPIDPARDAVPAGLTDPFPVQGQIPRYLLDRTIERCARDRIAVFRDERMSASKAGYVARRGPFHDLAFGDEHRECLYVVVLNGQHRVPVQYVTLAHELAHLFCGHIGNDPEAWWLSRPGLSARTEELEAESVAYLVALRAGLHAQSEQYLAGYVQDRTATLPDISLETVLAAVAYIEGMGNDRFRSKRRRKATRHGGGP